jgi:asparagine synthase (glutamine-hydrolysing)
MLQSTLHRGPDGMDSLHSTWDDYQLSLGHNLLAIQSDATVAKQPLESADGRYALVFNGEIYNHTLLRQQLIQSGTQFLGPTDTEVLLHWLIKFGLAGLRNLEGIFAGVFLDHHQHQVHLFRDAWGVKPLYYHLQQGLLVAASEISALKSSGVLQVQFDEKSCIHLLRKRYVPLGKSIYKEVAMLKPGQILTWHAEGEKTHFSEFSRNDSIKPKNLKSALEEALKKQVQAAVPVGIMFSGGIDSTLLAAIASRVVGVKPTCFTIRLAEDPDFEWAQKAAKRLGLALESVPIGPDSFQAFLQFSASLSQPLPDPAVWLTYLLSQKANAMGVKVLLSGAGADELFGGYNRHRAFAWYLKLRYSPLWPLIKPMIRLLSPCLGTQVQRISKNLSGNDFSVFYHAEGNQFLGMNEHASLPYFSTFGLSEALHYDQRHYLIGDVLATADLGGMMAGVEVRVPFLDSGVVQWAEQHMPTAAQLRNQTKPALKNLLSELGFSDVVNRKKQGFGFPIDTWMKLPENRELVFQLIHPQSFVAKLLGFQTCNQILKSKAFAMEKSALLMVEAWMQKNSEKAIATSRL